LKRLAGGNMTFNSWNGHVVRPKTDTYFLEPYTNFPEWLLQLQRSCSALLSRIFGMHIRCRDLATCANGRLLLTSWFVKNTRVHGASFESPRAPGIDYRKCSPLQVISVRFGNSVEV